MIRLNKGFIYIWMLFAVALLGIVMAGIGQVWQTKSQREKELELLFVGEQFQKAITSYYNNATGAIKQYPESLEDLLLDDRSSTPKRHLRKIFLDPMTNSYEWGLVREAIPEQTTGVTFMDSDGIIGVYSRSKKVPIKEKNFPDEYADFSKADSYQDWRFTFYVKDDSAPQPTQTQTNSKEKDAK
jgi:type II secretory pathway pseudopilin PulG